MDKNLLALTAKTVQVLLRYQVKVEQRKPVQINSSLRAKRKARIQKVHQKTPVSEIAQALLLVAFHAANNE